MPGADAPFAAFVSLEPEAALHELIVRYKAAVRLCAGDQLYLDDSPHLTVYLAMFAGADELRACWPQVAAILASFPVTITGWHVFDADPLTGNHTLVCEPAEHDKARLRDLQREVVELLAPLRAVAATNAYFAPSLDKLSPLRQQCLVQHGFPFLGDDWQPHFTIASIRPSDWPRVWERLASQPPQGQFRCERARLYRLQGDQWAPLLADS